MLMDYDEDLRIPNAAENYETNLGILCEPQTNQDYHHVFYTNHQTERTQPSKFDLNTFTRKQQKPLLFAVKARIGEQDVNILLDPGSTVTMMSKNLEAKLQKDRTFGRASLVKSSESRTLLLAAIAECRKQCRSESASLSIPTEEGNAEINEFLLK